MHQMKRITIIAIIFLLSRAALCQSTTFSKVFGNDSSLGYGGVSITSYNDSIYFSMFDQDLSVSYQATTFIKTDPNGNLSISSRLFKPDFYFDGGLLRMTKNENLISGGGSGSLVVQADMGTFYKFNKYTLDTFFLNYYSHGNISVFYGFCELSDGNLLFCGEAGDNSIQGRAAAWMVKTDTMGNEIWQKTMASDDYNGAYTPYTFNGGFYQPWGTAHRNTASGNPADSAIFVDKYDNNGNLIWRDTFGTIGYDNAQGPFTGIKEGGGVITLNILDMTGSQSGPTVIYKFDTNGAIVWQKYFQRSPMGLLMNSMTETESGDIVICGEGYGKIRNTDTIFHDGGCILKLDKNGNTIFYQVYDYDSTWQDILNDITETADGGYACVGDAYEHIGNTNYERAWLLKVDSNGCLNGDCPTLYTGIKPIADLINFFVFPNPATSQFTVALAGPNDIYGYSDLHFTLFDLTGRLVMDQPLKEQTTVLHRNDLTSGMYLWQIADDNKTLSNGKLVLR